jgi:hypothetical protein
MNRRNSSRSRRSLNRSKSAASVRSVVDRLEHIDPITARRDAHIAATLSFSRAKNFTRFGGDPIPNDPATYSVCRSESRASHLDHRLHRQQSIRFVAPSISSKRSRSTLPIVPTSTSKLNPENILGNFESRANSRTSSIGKTCTIPSLTSRYLSSVQVPEGHYIPEDDVASIPSSYRKLRKSRSLFDPLIGASLRSQTKGRYTNTYPEQIYPATCFIPANKENEPPKSMSFLRNDEIIQQSKTENRQVNDIAVQLAGQTLRQQVQQQQQQQRVRSQPSLFFRSISRRDESSIGMRKSLRKTSNDNINGIPPTPSIYSLSVSKGPSFRTKARKASKNFKSKLKNLFHLGKTDHSSLNPSSPELSRCTVHKVENDNATDPSLYANEFNFQPLDKLSLSVVPSSVPKILKISSSQQLRSRQGSLESIGTDRKEWGERSRTPNWTSSGDNTITCKSQIGQNEWERQRLSIIKENGVHISKSSSTQPVHGSQMISSRGNSIADGEEQFQTPENASDNQRVYSALMKRLEETRQREQRIEQLRQRSVDNFRGLGLIPPRTSSVERTSNSPSWYKTRTIRQVAPDYDDDDVFQDKKSSLAEESQSSQGKINTLDRMARKVGPNRLAFSSTGSLESHLGPRSKVPAFKSNGASEKCSMDNESRDNRGSAISSRTSAFFGSPVCHMFRTTSPYRRAVQKLMNEAESSTNNRTTEVNYLLSSSTLNLPLRRSRSSSRGSDKDHRVAYSESIYSSVINDNESLSSTDRHALVESFPTSPKCNIGESTSFGASAGDLGQVPQRIVSNTSSIEWKTLLSSKISSTEAAPTGNCRSQEASHISALSRVQTLKQIPEINDGKENMPFEGSRGKCLQAIPIKEESRNNSNEVERESSNCLTSSQTNAENIQPPRYDSIVSSLEYPAPIASENIPITRESGPPPIPVKSALRCVPSLPLLSERTNMLSIADTKHHHIVHSQQRANQPNSQLRTLHTMPDLNRMDFYELIGDEEQVAQSPGDQNAEGRCLVDLVLNSRRRKIIGSDESSVFI